MAKPVEIVKKIKDLMIAKYNERVVLHCQNDVITQIDYETIPRQERTYLEIKPVVPDVDIEISRLLNDKFYGKIYLDFCKGKVKDLITKRNVKV